MNINIKQNKKPKLCMPSFNVDNELSSKLNEYEITKLMNKSNFTLFLGVAGSGKTSLMTSLMVISDMITEMPFTPLPLVPVFLFFSTLTQILPRIRLSTSGSKANWRV